MCVLGGTPPTITSLPRIGIDATHIYDGLGSFPTHVAHMRLGSFITEPTPWPFNNSETTGNPALYSTALQWLKEDREYRRDLERQGRKSRGARRDVSVYYPICCYPLTNCFRAFRPTRRLSLRSERSTYVAVKHLILTTIFRYDYAH